MHNQIHTRTHTKPWFQQSSWHDVAKHSPSFRYHCVLILISWERRLWRPLCLIHSSWMQQWSNPVLPVQTSSGRHSQSLQTRGQITFPHQAFFCPQSSSENSLQSYQNAPDDSLSELFFFNRGFKNILMLIYKWPSRNCVDCIDREKSNFILNSVLRFTFVVLHTECVGGGLCVCVCFIYFSAFSFWIWIFDLHKKNINSEPKHVKK